MAICINKIDLAKDKEAYFSRFVYSAEEAIKIIKNSGGIAVLAHPSQIHSNFTDSTSIVEDLVDIGLDGIEVYYPTHSAKMRRQLKKITQRHDLVMSGGSDYHGKIRPGTDLAGGLNVYVPIEVLERMKQKWLAGSG